MKNNSEKKPGKLNLKLQKIKNKKYYVKVPSLKVPVVLNEYLFKKWKKASLLD